SLAVVRAGKLVQTKGYGKASLELDAPATTSTLYGLGSISKQFTATAIMLLVEEGEIGLDHRLTNYFSWLPKEWDEVTVRHLLAHRIFRPIGMEATRNSDPKTVILNRARGYGISGGKYENREPVTASAAFSEGALISSVLDMVKWDAALNSEALLKKTSLDQ